MKRNKILSEKHCSRCGGTFPATAEFFRRQASTKDGLKYICKRCDSEHAKNYYYENREKIIKKSSDYQVEHPKEYKSYQKEYQRKRREGLRKERDGNVAK